MVNGLEIIFWVSVIIIFYTYLGYGILLYILVKIKRLLKPAKERSITYFTNKSLPEVTLLVTAFNEADCIEEKIRNSFSLHYPKDKLKFLFITDGSTDGTEKIIGRFPSIQLMHQHERKGKIAAINRAVPFIKSPVIIFSDANTILNNSALLHIVKHYQDRNIAGVAGEKRIINNKNEKATGAGEGFYWKYESALKKWDAELYTVVGAAGELFSLRKVAFEPIPEDTVIEDFYLTMKIAGKGFKVVYEPDAFAMEMPSESIREELKRKIRIAAGGIQSIIRLKALLNPFRFGLLSFQYISHRVLRWTLAPFLLFILFLSNLILSIDHPGFYEYTLLLQIAFYLSSVVGWVFENRSIRIKPLFIPFYFIVMNYAVYAGFFRYMEGKQSVLWEKAVRSKVRLN